MSKKLYVGGLPFQSTDADLEAIFTKHGEVSSARIIADKLSGQSRGFGFVEMPNDTQAADAVEKLNGTEFEGRTLTVNEARPVQARPGGFGGGRDDRGGRGSRKPRNW